MKKLFAKDPYAHIVNFIDAAVDSQEISAWLKTLEKEPGHMRSIRLAEIKHQMEYSQAPEKHIEIVEIMNHLKILQAMNSVIAEVRKSGLPTAKYLRKGDDTQYNLLISLVAAVVQK